LERRCRRSCSSSTVRSTRSGCLRPDSISGSTATAIIICTTPRPVKMATGGSAGGTATRTHTPHRRISIRRRTRAPRALCPRALTRHAPTNCSAERLQTSADGLRTAGRGATRLAVDAVEAEIPVAPISETVANRDAVVREYLDPGESQAFALADVHDGCQFC
jgi:hypothetical protein